MLVPWKRHSQAPSFSRSMERFHQDMDQLMNRFFEGTGFGDSETWATGAFNPNVELRRSEKGLHVSAELPGMKLEDLSVEVADGVLTIKGEKKEEKREEEKGMVRTERSYGSFSRAIPLGEGVHADEINASLKDGVLQIDVPMDKPEREVKRVAING